MIMLFSSSVLVGIELRVIGVLKSDGCEVCVRVGNCVFGVMVVMCD